MERAAALQVLRYCVARKFHFICLVLVRLAAGDAVMLMDPTDNLSN